MEFFAGVVGVAVSGAEGGGCEEGERGGGAEEVRGESGKFEGTSQSCLSCALLFYWGCSCGRLGPHGLQHHCDTPGAGTGDCIVMTSIGGIP